MKNLLLSVGCSLLIFSGELSAVSYWQRFAKLRQQGSSNNDEAAEILKRKLESITKKYPWLAEIEQPVASKISFQEKIYRLDKFPIQALPSTFLAKSQITYEYPDGNKATHVHVSEKTIDYYAFMRSPHDPPAIVFLEGQHGETTDNYIYVERPLSFLSDQFSDFDFHAFLKRAEPPLLNVAAGGTRLAKGLSGAAGKAGKQMHVFNLDVSGSLDTYQLEPWYLFANAKDTGLPDNTFGATILLGGPLKKLKLDYLESIRILQEMSRITTPNGRLLVEITIPIGRFLSLLAESGVEYKNYSSTYSSARGSWEGKISLVEIVLDKHVE